MSTESSTPERRATRRQLRETERADLVAAVTTGHRARAVRRVLPRAVVLAAIGALTVVVPAAGFAAAEPSAPPSADSAPAVLTQDSALDVLDAAAGERQEAAQGATRLLANPAAPVRANAVQASRAGSRAELAHPGDDDAASGTRAALVPEPPVVMPLAAGTYNLTSRYGPRVHPISGVPGTHTGTDFSAPVDTPIHAVSDGEVTYVGPGKDGRSGMIITLRHQVDGVTFYSWYNHMYSSGVYVEVGQKVVAGQVIGGVGNNGNSTGAHLHFEIHTDEALTTVDPLAWLSEHGAVDVGELG